MHSMVDVNGSVYDVLIHIGLSLIMVVKLRVSNLNR